MKILIVSEKTWNQRLPLNLKRLMPEHDFHLINNKNDLEYLDKFNPDKIFFPHWSHIIPEYIFQNFECIVFHMTDLPFGRGGSPLQNLISMGFSETILSALRVVKELDAGPIYLKKSLCLEGRAEEIFLRANDLMEKMIKDILDNDIKPVDQAGEVVIFKRRTPEMSDIQNVEVPKKLFDHIRMLDAEGYPKAFLETEHFRFEFSRAALNADQTINADVRIFKK